MTLFHDLTLLRQEIQVSQRTPSQAVATLPPGLPPGQYLVLVANEFGTARSLERLSVTP